MVDGGLENEKRLRLKKRKHFLSCALFALPKESKIKQKQKG